MIHGIVTFGASGAVSAASGGGVQGVTKLATGLYKIKLVDNYVSYTGGDFHMLSGITGSPVTAGSFVTGTLYQITALGSTTQAQWVTAGLDADYTAAVGVPFVAAAAGAGTGTATALASSGIANIEVAQSASGMITNLNPVLGRGSSIIISTYGATSSSVTTLIPASPASGSMMGFNLWFSDSTVRAL